ncbi:HlyD family secretion protein [Roseovarius sp. MMSF_3281]|uniref:HlyD family secretion protein n=1 Tax=Roseovarius sp. MMSF_3281 TaxID=3046694 RepID=UPI00273E5D77|nr:HlyD family secretion protein [Roseovarius sp. MMSF_3281]
MSDGNFQKTTEAALSDHAGRDGARGAFYRATDQAAFLRGWSAFVAEAHPGLRRLVVMAEDEGGGAFRPVSVWPEEDADISGLSEVIIAAADAEGAVIAASGAPCVAVPVHFENGLAAIVAGETAKEVRALTPVLEMAAGWLAARLWEGRARDLGARHGQAVVALDSLAVLAAERRAPDAAAALVNELVSRFDLTRASIAFVRGRPGKTARLKLAAVSRAAWFRRRGKLARSFENAMEEALQQFESVVLPQPDNRRTMVDAAHGDLRDETGAAGLATVLLYDGDIPAGAITVEADAPLNDETLTRIEAVAALAGPVLGLKRRQNAWIAGRGADMAGRGLRALFGRHRPSYRLAAVVILALLIAPFVIHGPLRVTADAVLEGIGQQAATAPVAGFIAEAPLRAGDKVQKGDLLLQLDDRDLRLEAQRWRSELAQLRQQERQALAGGERAESTLIAAQVAQAEAQLALAAAQLERTRINAPISGVILSGDHAGRIGAPVEQGELMYEIAPEDAVRAALRVDERDVALVEAGQEGTLALAARPGLRLPLEVSAVVPVAEARPDGTGFRAEARLQPGEAELLPGMEGVARVTVGEASYAAILTRRLRDWAGLTIWRWSP